MAETHEGRVLAAEITQTNTDGHAETVTGTLIVSPDSPTHLITLTAGFPSNEPDIPAFFSGVNELETYPLLHIQTEDGLYTAIDSRVTSSKRTFGGPNLSRIVLRPSFVIKGSALLWENELKITEASVRFWDQDDWAEWSGWSVEQGTSREREVTVIQRAMPTYEATVNGAKVTLEDASPWFYHPRSGRLDMKQTSVFRVRFIEEVPLRDFMADWLRPLSFLIASGSRRTAGVEEMWISNSNWKSDLDGSPIGSSLQVIPRNPTRKEQPSRPRPAYLHRLRHFEFSRQLQTVFNTFESHDPAISQYLDFIHHSPTTPMVRLTLMAQLVETFDRSLNPDPPLTDELREKAERVKTIVAGDDDVKKFAADAARVVHESVRPTLASRLSRMDKATGRLVTTTLGGAGWKTDVPLIRNSVVHGLEKADFFTKNVIPLQTAEDILNLLFEARLLVALGFDSEQTRDMITQDDPGWWQRRELMVKYLSSFELFKRS